MSNMIKDMDLEMQEFIKYVTFVLVYLGKEYIVGQHTLRKEYNCIYYKTR